MIWLLITGIVGFVLAVLVLIALCSISGGYSEQDCEDYLRGHYDP
jgi:hypothetical protein